jgi:energy-coupling factor transporter ATP-binding protein EcfA2
MGVTRGLALRNVRPIQLFGSRGAMKINVIGTSGSGKSTLARSIAQKLEIPCIELDALFWRPGWQETPDEAFFAQIEATLAGKQSWVIDGNYTRTQALKWRNIDMIVWVDYSFPRTLYQAIKRAATRAWTQTELWPGTGNRESFRRSFFSRDSIILWTLQNYAKNRRRYGALFADPNWQHIRFVRLRSPGQMQAFIRNLS